MPLNTFDFNLKLALVQLATSELGSICQNIVSGDNKEPDVLPRVVFNTSEQEEIIYQSGNYRTRVEVLIKTNISDSTPADSETLFATVLDFFQQEDLNSQLTDTDLVIVQGSIIQPHQPSGVEDFMWTKKLEVYFFGFSQQ